MACSVLVIDEDPAFRGLVSEALDGHRVVEAETAAAALEALSGDSFELLVVDGLLPDMVGVDLLEEARRLGVTTPAVFVSGLRWSAATFERLEIGLGVLLALRKPVSRHELTAQLRGLLEPPAAGEAVAEPAPVTPEPEVRARLEALREAYAESLADRSEDLEREIASARAGDTGALRRAYRIAHKLHGTAGSYGFAGEGEAAALVEATLEPLIGEEIAPEAATWRTIDQALAVLRAGHGGEEAALEERSRTTPPPDTGTVLVVDDDPEAQRVLDDVASRMLLRVLRADTAERALAAARRSHLDAAVLGVERAVEGPDASFALARRLRALPGLSGLPIAFASRDPGMSTRVAAVHAGGTLFLVKPHDSVALEYALGRLTAARTEALPRLLLLDDDAEFSRRLQGQLEGAPLEVAVFTEPRGILERLADARPDVLLLDVVLGGVSGFDVCRVLRAAPEWHDLPVVFLSERTDAEVRQACYEAGADDFLPKPPEVDDLLARVGAHAARARLHRAEAMRDPLTGLLTRRAFTDAAMVRLSEARRRRQPVSLAILDLDRFKLVNDTHGHLAGDRVLAGLGQLLRSHLRAEDARGRWGGEEFTLCVYGEAARRAGEIIGRAHEEMASLSFPGRGGRSFQVTFSGGVAGFPADGDTLEALFRAADRRLYAAKRAGRHRIFATDGE